MPGPSELGDAGVPLQPVVPRVVEERPPPGPARGKFVWPAWGIGVLGGMVVALGLVWIAWRFRKWRRQ